MDGRTHGRTPLYITTGVILAVLVKLSQVVIFTVFLALKIEKVGDSPGCYQGQQDDFTRRERYDSFRRSFKFRSPRALRRTYVVRATSNEPNEQ